MDWSLLTGAYNVSGIVLRHWNIAMNRTNKNFCPQGINILTEVRKTINNSRRYELRVLSKYNRKDGKEIGRQWKKTMILELFYG